MTQTSDKTDRFFTWPMMAAVLTAAVIAITAQWPLISDPWSIDDDTRSSYRRVYSMADDNERPVDLFAEQMLSRQSSFILTGLIWVAANVFPYVPMTKWFPVLLMALTAGLVYRIFLKLSGTPWAALALLIPFTLYGWATGTAYFRSGLAPSDMLLPLCATFLFGLIDRRPLATAASLLAALDLYAPAFILLAITLTIFTGSNLVSGSMSKKFRIFLVSLLVIASALFLAKYSLGPQLGNRDLVSIEQMRGMPEYHAGGRNPMLFPGDPLSRLTNCRSGLCVQPPWLVLFLLSLGLTLLAGARSLLRVPREVTAFCAGSLFIFILSNALLFRLFSPSRYIRFSIPLVLFCVAAAALRNLSQDRKGRKAAAITLLVLATAFLASRVHTGRETLRTPALATHLGTLEPTAVIAASPNLSDTLNVFADRNTYVSAELTLAYFPRYYDPVKIRTERFFEAYYGAGTTGMEDLCRSGVITHLVVDNEDFESLEERPGRLFYRPFDDRLQQLVSDEEGRRHGPDHFGVYRMPEELASFSEGGFRVYSCEVVNSLL